MPLYFRDSISFGPFRINLSKSGIGMSAGIKGFRVGAGPRGHYIHAGVSGIYYRKTLRGIGAKQKADHSDASSKGSLALQKKQVAPTYQTQDGVLMRRILSSGAEELQDASRADTIVSLNEACQRVGFLMPVVCIGGGIAVLLAMSPALQMGAVVVGAITAFFAIIAARADLSRRNVVMAYQLEEDAEKTFRVLVDALDDLGRSDGLWYVDASGDVNNLTAWKRNAGASQLVSKHKTSVNYDAPPGVQSNITPPSLKVQGKVLYFMPDCILVREGKVYGSVSYSDLRLATRPSRFIVHDVVPRDAEVVGSTWKHPNKNGGPDRRFNDNRELPICLFEELGIISSKGLKALVMASSRRSVNRTESALNLIAKSTHETKVTDQIALSYET